MVSSFVAARAYETQVLLFAIVESHSIISWIIRWFAFSEPAILAIPGPRFSQITMRHGENNECATRQKQRKDEDQSTIADANK